jgi:hypothetical protein
MPPEVGRMVFNLVHRRKIGEDFDLQPRTAKVRVKMRAQIDGTFKSHQRQLVDGSRSFLQARKMDQIPPTEVGGIYNTLARISL